MTQLCTAVRRIQYWPRHLKILNSWTNPTAPKTSSMISTRGSNSITKSTPSLRNTPMATSKHLISISTKLKPKTGKTLNTTANRSTPTYSKKGSRCGWCTSSSEKSMSTKKLKSYTTIRVDRVPWSSTLSHFNARRTIAKTLWTNANCQPGTNAWWADMTRRRTCSTSRCATRRVKRITKSTSKMKMGKYRTMRI